MHPALAAARAALFQPIIPGPAVTAGLYIHIPWCRAICTYCDFDRQARAFELIPAYVDALVTDLRRQPPLALHSIYFGGGTPSLLEPRQVAAVLDAARAHFAVDPEAEITLEANPGDLDAERVRAYRRAGINRLSLGVQSFDDALLRLLGRRHTGAEAVAAVRAARAGGITNLSLDLMYGLPGQTPGQWRATLARALELEPEHLSAYLLTLDDRVPLGRQVQRGRILLPEDDLIAEMYAETQALLGAHGYEQYEISNWAKPGRASRHNLTYWRDEPYLGVGAGAAASLDGRRTKQTPDPAAYIKAIAEGRAELVEDDRPDPLTAAQDFVALSLRLREGLDLGRFAARFGRSLLQLAAEPVAELRRRGLLELDGGRLRIPARHLLISSAIILRLHEALAASWDTARPAAGAQALR